MYNIEELVETARRAGASDVHIVCGLPPKFRLDGQLESMFEGRLSEEDCEQLCRDLARESYDSWNTPESWIFPESFVESAADVTFSGSRARYLLLSVC